MSARSNQTGSKSGGVRKLFRCHEYVRRTRPADHRLERPDTRNITGHPKCRGLSLAGGRRSTVSIRTVAQRSTLSSIQMLPDVDSIVRNTLPPPTSISVLDIAGEILKLGESKCVSWTGSPTTTPRTGSKRAAHSWINELSAARKYNVLPSADHRGLSAHLWRRGTRVHGRSGGPSTAVTPRLAPATILRSVSNTSQRPFGEYCPCHKPCCARRKMTREGWAVVASSTGHAVISSWPHVSTNRSSGVQSQAARQQAPGTHGVMRCSRPPIVRTAMAFADSRPLSSVRIFV